MKVIDPAILQEVVTRIVNTLCPDKIFLYGSHAYGEPNENSDIDILVITSDLTTSVHSQAVKAYQALRGLLVPVEIKVDTIEEFQKRSSWLSSIERVVEEKGKVLYDAAA
ncbi:MAG: nucleotidyltransferase domain-containing protein [Chitinispirillaceae bacterium]|nr:nucleotidyltransferase domain-containing protein [Chitinispirillaceae bacterium]